MVDPPPPREYSFLWPTGWGTCGRNHRDQPKAFFFPGRREGIAAHRPPYHERARKKELEKLIQTAFYRWQKKVQKLGCQAKGMWLVDFDNGQGYYCWHYPEPDICYFHGYDEGFRGRVKIH